MMKNKYAFAVESVFLPLFVAVSLAAQADESASPPSFKYVDDWALVSAPPPPGPYRAVNIDPRVPGQGEVPPMTVSVPQARPEIPAEALANAPAAGGPVDQPLPDRPVQALQPPAPGRYNRMMPAPPEFSYPARGRYPEHAGYPGYRNVPPSGYYNNPSLQRGVPGRELQVPPPPVYDAMNNSGQKAGGQGNP